MRTLAAMACVAIILTGYLYIKDRRLSMMNKLRGWWKTLRAYPSLGGFVLLLAAQIFWVVLSLVLWPDRDPPLLTGFRGNTISGMLGGFMLLSLALFLNAGIEAIQIRRAEEEDDAKKVQEFKSFLRHASYYNIRFPQMKTEHHKLGLEYTIEPVRRDGIPLQLETEMETFDVVKVRSIAEPEEQSAEDKRDYESAPIHTGEYYFCRFYNHAWHMGQMNMLYDWKEFYMSGKVGPVEHGFSANRFVGAEAALANSVKLCDLVVKDDGTRLEGDGGGTLVEIRKAKDGEVSVQISGSPPKSLYIKHDLYDEPKGPVIDNLEGYFPGPARARFVELVMAEMRRLREHVPKRNIDDDA